MTGKIFFLRHGQTDANKNGVFCGRPNFPLNEEGVRQACMAGERLCDTKFDAMLFGLSRRVLETAQIVRTQLHNSPIETLGTSWIRELNFGSFENLSNTEIETRFPQEWRAYMDCWQSFKFPSGDDIRKYFIRCTQFTAWLCKTFSEKKVLVVAHKGFILNCLAALHKEPLDMLFCRDIANGGTIEISMRAL
ncbi:MAG: histidine phosphatase family protein [Christensenella sp.]|nr:histidine phosphatase family protein [Christensenella sp.]